jgi:hypothetical protein
VDTARLLQLRLVNQRLLSSPLTRPEQVVAALGAVQAQDYPAAKWAVGQRLPQGTDVAVEKAFNSGRILRTHVLRPTWHFVSPRDIRWMLDLTGPRLKRLLQGAYRRLGLQEQVLRASSRALGRALGRGEALTREELAVAVREAGVSLGGMRMGPLLAWAEFDGLICSGPRRGRHFTYMLFEARVPRAARLGRDEALAELALRYFESHGPATLRDFIWWSGLTAADAKRGIAAVARKLEQAEADRTTYWWREPPSRPKPPAAAFAHLLPVYDEYFVAYRDRSAAAPDRRPASPSTFHDNPIFYPTVVVNGRLVSAWTRTIGKAGTVVTAGPPAVAASIKPAIAAAAARYERFLGRPVSVRWK